MIVKPKIRGFMCTTAHPEGCKAHVEEQIVYVGSRNGSTGAKKVLVIGASTGMALPLELLRRLVQMHQPLGHFLKSQALNEKQVLLDGITLQHSMI